MRVAAYGPICVAVLVAMCCAMSLDLPTYGQPPKLIQAQPALPTRLPVAAAGNIIAFCSEAVGGPSQVTLIDVEKHTMSVYHIDRATGEIELKSVRNFHWDLLIDDFNGVIPLPRDIRALKEPK